MHRAVGFAHIVESAPTGQIGFVVWIIDIARVLVPRKLHARFGTFDDILLPKQIGVITQRGAADLGHQLAKEKLSQYRLLFKTVGDKVAAAAVVDAERIAALGVHARVHLVDGLLTLAAQQFEIGIGNGALEDHIALVAVERLLVFADIDDAHGLAPKKMGRENRSDFRFCDATGQ